MKIIQGSCLEVLKTLPPESISGTTGLVIKQQGKDLKDKCRKVRNENTKSS